MSPKIPRRTFLAVVGSLAAPKLSPGEVDPPVVLDHILLGCNDLDGGVAFVEKRTGVRAIFGGIHPERGTRNALLSLGENHYLEIIAPDPQQGGTSDMRNLRQLAEPRLVGWPRIRATLPNSPLNSAIVASTSRVPCLVLESVPMVACLNGKL
jgi:glyoxalase-like protein